MERAYFAEVNFRDLAKKYAINIKNTIENIWNKFLLLCNFAIFLKIAKIKFCENK